MQLLKVVRPACLVLLVVSCAATQLVRQGSELLKAGKHTDAIAKFEAALKVDPGNAEAQDGIKQARREAVRAQLDLAEGALSAGEFASALKEGTKARRM